MKKSFPSPYELLENDPYFMVLRASSETATPKALHELAVECSLPSVRLALAKNPSTCWATRVYLILSNPTVNVLVAVAESSENPEILSLVLHRLQNHFHKDEAIKASYGRIYERFREMDPVGASYYLRPQ